MPARLRRCDLAECQGMCCHDGVWLEPGEARTIRRLLHVEHAYFAYVRGRALLRVGEAVKTATRPFRYRAPLPAHFTATKCVFGLDDGRCGLQALAEARGLHPWVYKPRACWLHPLRENASTLLPPPDSPERDPDRAEGYPGFVSFTACGRHDPDGEPWEEVLAAERRYWRPRADGDAGGRRDDP